MAFLMFAQEVQYIINVFVKCAFKSDLGRHFLIIKCTL